MSPQERTTMMIALANGWEESGMTQEQYASAHDLSIHTLRYWLYKRRESRVSEGRFIELSEAYPAGEYVIRYRSGIELKVPSSTPVAIIRSLINL